MKTITTVNVIKSILYATNLGDNMRPVFRQAIHMAKIHNAKITMLHAVAPIGNTGHTVLSFYMPEKQIHEIEQGGMRDVMETMKKRLENYCHDEEDICAERDRYVENVVVVKGKPGEVITHYAGQHEIDLIVVGSHARDPNTGMLGSAARYITTNATVPVLVIPNR